MTFLQYLTYACIFLYVYIFLISFQTIVPVSVKTILDVASNMFFMPLQN